MFVPPRVLSPLSAVIYLCFTAVEFKLMVFFIGYVTSSLKTNPGQS